MRQNIKTQTGNRIVVQFDGQSIGLVQTADGSDDYGPEPASGIGDIHVQENVPTLARHTVSVSKMVLKNEPMRKAGLMPENGDAVLQGNVFDIVYIDKDTGQTLRKYISCSFASGQTRVEKNAIVVDSGTFLALDVKGTGI